MFTSEQIAALKYLIFRSKNGTELSKRIVAFLVESSDGLAKDVCFTLVVDREGYTADDIRAAAHGIHAMISCNCTTHLNEILSAMGSNAHFSFHYGDFDPNREDDPLNSDGIFAGLPREVVTSDSDVIKGMPLRYTFWFSRKHYSREAKLLVVTRDTLEQIDLKKPGLYPTLEPA